MATNREKFISEIEQFIDDVPDGLSEEARAYFEELKSNKCAPRVSGGMTENGIKILSYMQENVEKYNNFFKSKEIGEGLFMSSRSVSGSMRKLVEDGYASKSGNDPVVYSLTDSGRIKEFN